MNIRQALQQGNLRLNESSPTARLDAEVLLAHVLQCNTAHLLAWPEKKLDESRQSQYIQLITLRQQGTPIAYLTGHREFWSMDFSVDRHALIPRPETETLVEYILTKFHDRDSLKLLDMGTGCGAIAIAIAVERPEWEITASDISSRALALTEKNSTLLQAGNINCICSNWFENITQNDFDVIVSNPPYIAANDPHLHQGDVRFEPDSALISGQTGMDDIKHLCLHAPDYLRDDGWLIVEHGYDQKPAVADCFLNNGFTDIEQRNDLSGQPRMTTGKKPELLITVHR